MSLVVAETSTLPNQDVEELEDALTKMKQEIDMWEERFHALSRKHEELQLESKDKDTLIEILEDQAMKRQREPEGLPSSSMP
jgi:chromosome segregation ATPase